MVASVLLVPYTVSGTHSIFNSIVKAILQFKLGGLILLLGASGLVLATKDDTEYWWLLTGAGWFLIQLLLIDYEGARDLYVGMAFAVIGFGLLYSRIETMEGIDCRVISGILIFAILGNLVIVMVLGIPSTSMSESKALASDHSGDRESIHNVYWNK